MKSLRPAKRILFFCFLAVSICTPVWGVDRDDNGVDDATESAILLAFAPIFQTDEGISGREIAPVSIDWYVRHCMISRWTEFYSGQSGSSQEMSPEIASDFMLTLDFFNTNLAASGEVGNNTTNQPYSGYWRLWFKNGDNHWGNDPTEPRYWHTAQEKQDVLYGRVNRFGLTGNQYVVQYFLFFPWNDVDDNRFCGCPAGNHEGDIACVEYLVEFTSSADYKVLQGIYHDHGRQVFAERSALTFSSGRPVVFPERETHELLPWPAECGIYQGSVQFGIATNKRFFSHDVTAPWCGWWDTPIAGECDDASIVRDHYGAGFTLKIDSVKNLHERSAPIDMHTPESLFVAKFAGLYGHVADDSCDVFTFPVTIGDFESPPGPPFQDKMWNRSYRRQELWVSLGDSSVDQTGEQTKPVSSMTRALALGMPGAVVHINSGSSAERVALTLPMTIRAEGGPVVIGH
jgi:hypothetical protein